MAIEGSASIEIDAPIEEVFEVAADVEESPRWQPDIKKAEVKERAGHKEYERLDFYLNKKQLS